MTIYISHSRKFDFHKELYAVLQDSELAKKHTFILPHAESNESYDTRTFFQSETCDLVIAEVSYPSTGQGIELGWADALRIPIICLYKKDAQTSQSLSLISKKLLMYTDQENMLEDITGALMQYE